MLLWVIDQLTFFILSNQFPMESIEKEERVRAVLPMIYPCQTRTSPVVRKDPIPGVHFDAVEINDSDPSDLESVVNGRKKAEP